MNEQQEKRVCFDIDQNKQKINHLMKKNKEQEDKVASICDTIETNQTDLQNLGEQVETTKDDLTTISASVSSLNTAVANLQAAAQTEEKIELMSYDIYRNRDNMYRNNRWEPSSVFFLCDEGAKFKLHIWFKLKANFPSDRSATLTTKFVLDDEEVFVQNDAYTGTQEFDVDFTGFFVSKKKSHKLVISTISTDPGIRFAYHSKPDIMNIELWGTNVMFVTRRNDFHIAPTDTKNLITTTCLDNRARLSMQAADENLSFDISNFRTVVVSSYATELNQIRPLTYHYMTDDGPVYEEKPAITIRFYPYENTMQRGGYLLKMKDSESDEQYPTRYQGGCEVLAVGFLNMTTDDISKVRLMMKNQSNILYSPEYNNYFYQFSQIDEMEIMDVNTPVRLDDMSTTAPVICIVTRQDGTTFLFECVCKNKADPQKLELGFGTNVNAYSTNQGFKIYMRVGKDTKVLIVKKNQTTQNLEIVSTQYIKNVQEFWHGANGTHFERVGDTIFYYLSGQTTPINSFKLDI